MPEIEDTNADGEADGAADPADAEKRSRSKKALIALGATCATAIVAAIGSGIGGKILDAFESDPPPPPEPVLVSSSDEEEVAECGTRLFAPEPVDAELLASPPPSFAEMLALPELEIADRSIVDVSIQGESERTVTLTGVDVEVTREPRPPGASFGLPCGDSTRGYQVVVDLERDPPQVVASVDAPDGQVGAVDAQGKPFPAIEFPWTVSVTDPLLLKIVARADTCVCAWTARIPWVSGGKRGELVVDNGGGDYVTVGQNGEPTYSAGNDEWVRFKAVRIDPATGTTG